MNKLHHCVAVITGAGSGIGRALSIELAKQGSHLAISDINQANLEQTKQLLQTVNPDIKVMATTLDVANEKAFFDYAKACQQEFGSVNLVVNNAGVALASGPLWQTSIDDFKWLMDINFYGVLYGTKAFLPLLREAEWGHIVNVSSLFGLITMPEQSAYNASKFAVRGMTEALRHELKLSNSTVSCTSVHPGGIKTNIARSARITERDGINSKAMREQGIKQFEKLARTTAEQAAQQIINAVLKDKARLLVGNDAKIIDKIQRLLPSIYYSLMARFFKLPDSSS